MTGRNTHLDGLTQGAVLTGAPWQLQRAQAFSVTYTSTIRRSLG